jgi:DNA-binding transcriptional MerR regulator
MMMTPDPRTTYSIRQLCREFGTTARALRFYEDKGLLSPERNGQTRIYAPRDRARLKLILRGKRLGFSLVEIHEILDLYDRKDGGAIQMAASLKKYRAQIDTLKRQREDIDAAISALIEGCEWMESHLTSVNPTLLPQAEDYDQLLRSRLDGASVTPLAPRMTRARAS